MNRRQHNNNIKRLEALALLQDQIKERTEKRQSVNYTHRFFEQDCIVTGRDLPSNALFSIKIRDTIDSQFVTRPVCTIFYHDDPTFEFKRTRNNCFTSIFHLKYTVTKILLNHGLSIVKWQPTTLNNTHKLQQIAPEVASISQALGISSDALTSINTDRGFGPGVLNQFFTGETNTLIRNYFARALGLPNFPSIRFNNARRWIDPLPLSNAGSQSDNFNSGGPQP